MYLFYNYNRANLKPIFVDLKIILYLNFTEIFNKNIIQQFNIKIIEKKIIQLHNLYVKNTAI